MRLPRAPLLLLSFPAAGGILAATVLPIVTGISLGIAGLISAALLRNKKNDLPAVLAVASFFLVHHSLAIATREAAPRWHEISAGNRLLAEVTGHIRNITPPQRGTRALWNYQLETTAITTGGRTYPGRWRVLLTCPDQSLGFGDTIRATGSYHLPPPLRNPGSFDRREWLLDQGYSAVLLTRDEVEHLGMATLSATRPLAALGPHITDLRQWLAATVTRGIEDDSPTASVIRAVVLGDRSGLPRNLEETFQRSGTMHLFAVSGLHVAMVAGLLLGAGRLLRLPGWIAMPLVLTGLILYTMATGLRPSACRAAVMIIAYWAALFFDRSPSLLNTLGLAALLLLGWNPWDLFSIGFQLSFAVMIGIGVWGAPLRDRLAIFVAPDPFLPRSLLSSAQRCSWKLRSIISDSLSISLGAWGGSCLPVALYFGIVTPIVVVANLFLIFPAFAILWIAGIATVAGSLGLGWIVVTVNNANWLVVKTVTALAALFAGVPGGHIELPSTSRIYGSGTLAEITVLHIPRGGGASHIALQNSQWLVDTGDTGSCYQAILPLLRGPGKPQLDGVILTHGDSLHAGGLPVIMEKMPGARIWRNPTPSNSPIETEITAARPDSQLISSLAAGDLVPLVSAGATSPESRATIEVLYPPAELHQPRLADDGCLVLRLSIDNRRILFTSDSGLAAEYWLLENHDDLEADLLVMGRHSADFCGDLAFLRAVNPQAIVASAANFPENEKLPPTWRARIEAAGFLLLDQQRTGAVSIQIHRNGIRCRTVLDSRLIDLPEHGRRSTSR